MAFGSVAVTRPPVAAGVQGAARIRAIVPGRGDPDLPCSEHLWAEPAGSVTVLREVLGEADPGGPNPFPRVADEECKGREVTVGPTSPRPHRSGPAGIPKGPYSQGEPSGGSGSWLLLSQYIQVNGHKTR